MTTKVYIISFLIIDKGLYLTSKNFGFREFVARKFFVNVLPGKKVEDAELELMQKLREKHSFKRIVHDYTKEIEVNTDQLSTQFLLELK